MTETKTGEIVEDVGFFVPVGYINPDASMGEFLQDAAFCPTLVGEPVLEVHSNDAHQPPTQEGAQWLRRELIKMVVHAARRLENHNHKYVMRFGYERSGLDIHYIGKVYQVAEENHQKQQPSVGRIVHYVAYGTPGGEFPAGAHRAAIITAVEDEGKHIVSLAVFNPTGLFFNQHLPYDSTGQAPGSWHWPERV